ncbi:hypothetical protein [Hufsiella ginkgonis]|uniref:Periplasmic heavy metal sensor n=1 Tax=Hufsiella ginkgonis TaxID=2695274 RepID=A0A7K1XU85_9SPHI|nr:hypothetical protein [Hufsiella ginkgonis]MXV14542.1 hypothetical protein [Hufsiella ginkgonis]
MRIINLILCITAFAGFSSQAQSSEPSKSERISYLVKNIAVEPLKAEEMVRIFDEYRQLVTVAKNDTSISKSDLQQRLLTISSERQTRLKQLLSPAQQERFFAMLQREITHSEAEKQQHKQQMLKEIQRPLNGATLKEVNDRGVSYHPIP